MKMIKGVGRGKGGGKELSASSESTKFYSLLTLKAGERIFVNESLHKLN